MIIDINETTLSSIRNPALHTYAGQYVRIYQDFVEQIRRTGINFEQQDDTKQVRERIVALGKKGAIVRNDGKSLYVNRISSACQACQTAVGSQTFFISLKCHRNCFFCFNPNQEEYEHYREITRDTIAELDALRANSGRVQHLALTGGEPLLHKEETIQFFQHARQIFPNVYMRLYTCGDHLERETLQHFKDAGLNEVRFSIRIEDTEKAQRHTYDQIALAREYIPNVMVEMPALPGKMDEMKSVLVELDRLGVFGINLLEFCYPYHNSDVYNKRGYHIKARPFRILYNYWYAGGLPVAGSETICLDLLAFALQKGLKLGVHYCSLENKHTGQIYQQNNGYKLPKRTYFSRKDYFIKTAKVFGEDIAAVKQLFDKSGYRDYSMSEQHNFLEFHVDKIRSLSKMNIEVGISSNVIESRDNEQVLRELKVDVTTPQTFRFSKDI
jgi:pyruvate formate-lyase activating enzyme-like uncharacterized protein